jgi:ankyrin repeat protein
VQVCSLFLLFFITSCLAMDNSSFLDYNDMKRISIATLDTYVTHIDTMVLPLAPGYNLLHMAAVLNAVDYIYPIIDSKKCAIDQHNNEKRYTPLFIACKNKCHDIVFSLLSSGANPNIASNNGRTPLIKAIQKNTLDSVSTLVLYGADVNQKDTIHDNTPLHAAIAYENSAVVSLLLNHGALPNLDLQYCYTPLMAAVQMNIDSRNEKTHNAKIIKELLDHNANPNIAYLEDQDTALHIAVNESNIVAVYLLLKAGSDPNPLNTERKTPLFLALENSIETLNNNDYHGTKLNCSIARLLLIYNAQIIEQQFEKRILQTILRLAIKFEISELAKFSLKAGANANYVYKSGNRPLHLIAKKTKSKKNQSFIIGSLLLQHGANLSNTNQEKHRAIDILLEQRLPLEKNIHHASQSNGC